MSYLNKYMLISAGVAGPVVVTSVADVQYFPMPMSQVVQRIEALVTTAVVSSAPVVISVFSRPTHGSTSGQVLLGTLSIPGGTAVGKCVYKDIADNASGQPVAAGQEIVFGVTTAAAGGGAAGAVLCMALVDDDPEVPLNQSNMVLSA